MVLRRQSSSSLRSSSQALLNAESAGSSSCAITPTVELPSQARGRRPLDSRMRNADDAAVVSEEDFAPRPFPLAAARRFSFGSNPRMSISCLRERERARAGITKQSTASVLKTSFNSLQGGEVSQMMLNELEIDAGRFAKKVNRAAVLVATRNTALIAELVSVVRENEVLYLVDKLQGKTMGSLMS